MHRINEGTKEERGKRRNSALELKDKNKDKVRTLRPLCMLLGRTTAEEILYEEVSTGVQNDLGRATDMAKSYGIGNVE